MFTDEPQIDISGVVTNKQNEPLAGASVVVKRTGKGAQTNVEGIFQTK